ncbi:MAG TPA: hypothetical protein VEC19_13330 [Usitatibacter sp.]|nr:hypothetical protein [Usitatibacter sp.]
MKQLRIFLLAFGLAAAFGIGQHAVALHALKHAVEELSQDSLPAPAGCTDHGLYASATGVAAGNGFAAPCPAVAGPALSLQRAGAACLPPRHAFNPRAPPASLA